MALSYSTGFIHKLLGGSGGGSMAGVLSQCVIDVYSGVRPDSADAPIPSGAGAPVLLGTITNNGVAATGDPAIYGLGWGVPVNRGIDKDPSQVWQFRATIAGTASWLRLRAAIESGTGASATAPRIDASVGTAFTDVRLSSVDVSINNIYSINQFLFLWP